MRPLWFLAWRRLVNSLRRVKGSPRLLLPILFFGFVIVLQLALPLIVGHVGSRHEPAGDAMFTPRQLQTGGPGTLIALVRGLLLFSIFTSTFAALGDNGGLFWLQSDVDFLFPAPLPRRGVLVFKMLGRYAGLLLTAAYVPLFGATTLGAGWGYRVSPFAFWPGILGAWLFLFTVSNTAQVILLRRSDNDEKDDVAAKTRRAKLQKIVGFLFAAFLLGSAYLLLRPASGDAGQERHITRTVLQIINGPIVSVVLAPVAWASDLFEVAFVGWRWADGARLFALLALAGGSLWALFSRNHDFYETALDVTSRRTKNVEAIKSGDAGTLLSQMAQEGKLARGREIAPFGGGWKAILWKDMTANTRTPLRSWITLLVLASLPAVANLFGKGTRHGVSPGFTLLGWVLVFVVQMSSVFLLSLRDMLRRADISKALPVSAIPMLFAELWVSVVLLTLLGWFSLLVTAFVGNLWGPLVLLAFLLVPTLAPLILFVQTSILLLYPNANDPAQNAVSTLVSLLACLLSLVPSVAFGVALFLDGASPLVMGMVLGAVNAVEAVAALLLAAFLWQRFDPSH